MGSFFAKHWRAMLAALFVLVLVSYVGLGLVIGWEVQSAIAAAQELAPGKPVSALLAVALSDGAPIRSRNRAVWALGQLGAREALPALESLVIDDKCDHETRICQHELRKAIRACSGSPNAGAIIWRHGDLAVR